MREDCGGRGLVARDGSYPSDSESDSQPRYFSEGAIEYIECAVLEAASKWMAGVCGVLESLGILPDEIALCMKAQKGDWDD